MVGSSAVPYVGEFKLISLSRHREEFKAPEELRTTRKEEYSNEKAPSDGEVYHKIRQYLDEENVRFQKRW
jgi:hypothetical protein